VKYLKVYEDFEYEYKKIKTKKRKKKDFPDPIYKCNKCIAQKKPLYNSGRNSEIQRLY
jgi:hypothetical protein